MARDRAKLDEILTAVVARLIDQVSGFSAASCYLSLDPDDMPSPNPSEFVCVVSPAGGGGDGFDQAMLDGGGEAQATLGMSLIVKLHSTVQLDETHRDTHFLTHSAIGILEPWRRAVKALTNWTPISEDGDEMTRDPLLPLGINIDRPGRHYGAIATTFRLTFDLDLT